MTICLWPKTLKIGDFYCLRRRQMVDALSRNWDGAGSPGLLHTQIITNSHQAESSSKYSPDNPVFIPFTSKM